MKRIVTVLAIALVLSSVSVSSVRADAIHNVATALDYAGFDARGSRNPLSGGYDLLINRQFTGNVFDFGATELALQGPVSMQVSTGGRLVPGVDVSFTTAFNDRNQAVPLNYNLTTDTGPQTTTISGSTLVDGSFSINALGFYDLSLTSSSRNTVDREGRVTNSDTIDSDLGPINVSGNVFADALVVLTDPLFEQSGNENPFDTLAKVMAGPTSNGLFNPVASMGTNEVAGMVVPEPTVIAFLLLGMPVVAWRSRWFR